MKIIIAHNNGVFNVELGLVSIALDINQVDKTYEDVEHFINLIGNQFGTKEKTEWAINQVKSFVEGFQLGLSIYELGKYSVTIEICKETNKIYMKDMVMEDMSIDIMQILNIFNQFNESFEEPQEKALSEEELADKNMASAIKYNKEILEDETPKVQEYSTPREISEQLNIPIMQIITAFVPQDIMVTMNQRLDSYHLALLRRNLCLDFTINCN